MNYIVLDLEWNQAYLQKAIAVQKRIGGHLRGEVIQIGAVKLDSRFRLAGSYSLIVRPQFFQKMHRHVSRLTGITQEMVDNGCPLPEAIERFHRFCGDDCVFLTWGPDDVPMLKDNLWAHRIASDWIDRVYDLQIIYNKQTDGINRQRSLEYAMEHFGLTQELPAHDALNDAYFTAQVAAKLDIARGIAEYDDGHEDILQDTCYGESDIGDKGFASPEEVMSDETVNARACPICGNALTVDTEPLHLRGHKHETLGVCETHGKLLITLRLSRNYDETWRARRIVKYASEEEVKLFRRKSEHEGARPRRRRHHRPRRRSAAGTEASGTEKA